MNSEIKNSAFRERLAELVGDDEPFVWAKRVGIPSGTFARIWNEGTIPKSEHLCRIAEAAGVSLDWLLLGKTGTPPPGGPDLGPAGIGEVHDDTRMVPHFDLAMSAGGGAFNDRAAVRDFLPFPAVILRRLVGRASADGLAIVDARGDSMEPTIGDGDLVLVDTHDKTLQDGLMAFAIDDIAYIKRLRPVVGGGVDIVSDNAAIYPPQTLPRERLADLRIFGRVRWVGRAF